MLISGGSASHTAMIVDTEGQKWVYECMSEDWFSPAGAVVTRMLLEDWVAMAMEAEFDVVW
jgi:hypothetical protein